MRYPQISVLLLALLLCLSSCREAIGEQHESLPNKNKIPGYKRIRAIDTVQKDTVREPLKKTKSKKKRVLDTLKPKMALLETE